MSSEICPYCGSKDMKRMESKFIAEPKLVSANGNNTDHLPNVIDWTRRNCDYWWIAPAVFP